MTEEFKQQPLKGLNLDKNGAVIYDPHEPFTPAYPVYRGDSEGLINDAQSYVISPFQMNLEDLEYSSEELDQGDLEG